MKTVPAWWSTAGDRSLSDLFTPCRRPSPSRRGQVRLFDESVLFCTTSRTELDIATIGNVVAFQADGELDEGTYWSVLLQGIASEVTDEWDGVQAASVWIKLGRKCLRWATPGTSPGEKYQWTEICCGRR